MTVNELGMLTVDEVTLAERGATPNASKDESENKTSTKKTNELDSILCCVRCSCYGLPAEFYNTSYCSIACRDTVMAQEEAIFKKIEQEQEHCSDNELKNRKRKISTDNNNASPSISSSSTASSSSSSSSSLSSSATLGTIQESNEDTNKKTKDNKEKCPASSQIKPQDSDSVVDDVNEGDKIPSYMEEILKQHANSEDEYKDALLTVKKIVKKGKILNNELQLQKNLRVTKLETNTVLTNGNATKANIDKISILNNSKQIIDKPTITSSTETTKIKTIQQPKSPNSKLEMNNTKNVIKVKPAPIIKDVCHDLDCGTLIPNVEKNDGNSSDASDDTVTASSILSVISEFPWVKYMNETKSKPAWIKLFKNAFPKDKNQFAVGYKLEAIDPHHQSDICAVTVAKIQGYRMRLHFDCYSKKYDFWVNVDSPNIFPCGFCNRHNVSLCPPRGHGRKTFNWLSYNTICKATAAPSSCFPTYNTTCTTPNLFRVGMKLEAVDQRNTFLVCVASVAAVIENRILVHFDSWGDVYDYWVDITSPYIRPIGWCNENNHDLTPPNGIKQSEFDWEKYLNDTKSVAAPIKAFMLRPHNVFIRGTKLEAVDKRAPHLIRVATVQEVLPYQIKIVFDGFPEHFGYWVDDDSPDIHPVGWAVRTGHPLEPPPKPNVFSKCFTPGCLGQGNIRSGAREFHTCVEDCPYSLENLGYDMLVIDRFVDNTSDESSSSPKSHDDEVIEVSDDDMNKKRWKWLGVREGRKNSTNSNKDVTPEKKITETSNSTSTFSSRLSSVPIISSRSSNNASNADTSTTTTATKQQQQEEQIPVLRIVMKKSKSKVLKKRRKKRRKCYKLKIANNNNNNNNNLTENGEKLVVDEKKEDNNLVKSFNSELNPSKWTAKQVKKYTVSILGNIDLVDQFEKEEIDGKGFLMLTKWDLHNYLNFSSEQAATIFDKITLLRSKVT